MSARVHDSAGLRLLLQSKLNGKAAGFRDTHLEAMLACGLNSEARLSSAGWSKLYDQAALPLALVEALLQAYNADALHNSDSPEKQPLAAYLISGSSNVSNCFQSAGVMLAVSQTADRQEGKRFTGVSCRRTLKSAKYRARIHWLGKAVWLGDFATEEEAAQMYDRAAICVRGSAAMLNYPREDYANDDLCNGWVACEEQLQVALSKFKQNKGFVSCSSRDALSWGYSQLV